jgi:hypothetical protein
MLTCALAWTIARSVVHLLDLDLPLRWKTSLRRRGAGH